MRFMSSAYREIIGGKLNSSNLMLLSRGLYGHRNLLFLLFVSNTRVKVVLLYVVVVILVLMVVLFCPQLLLSCLYLTCVCSVLKTEYDSLRVRSSSHSFSRVIVCLHCFLCAMPHCLFSIDPNEIAFYKLQLISLHKRY